MLTLHLDPRPLLIFAKLFCSVALHCSDTLACAEELTSRFYWDTL